MMTISISKDCENKNFKNVVDDVMRHVRTGG